MATSRIPFSNDLSFDGINQWFLAMQAQGLLFHPDDDPADIVCNKSCSPLFTPLEINELRNLLNIMFEHQGDDVYEAAYPVFMATIKVH